MPSLLLNRAKLILVSFHLPCKIPHKNPSKTLSLTTKMSSWACSKCTFINPPSQKSRCQICLSAPQPQSTLSSSSSPPKPMWSCAACTFLNPYRSTICEICGTRASASLLSTLELDDDDLDRAHLGPSSVGSVFLPLRNCSNTNKVNTESSACGGVDAGLSGELKGVNLTVQRDDNGVGNRERAYVGGGGGSKVCDSGGKGSLLEVLRPCSNKRKVREEPGVDGGGDDAGGSSGFRAVTNTANKAVEVEPLGETHMCSKSKTLKILSYNVWFREDLEMHSRMRALGNLIELHLPDVICFQEVTPSFYEIFQRSNWWKGYRCSISNNMEFPGAYFCMQLCKLPVKSYSCKPFQNSIMGRELCIAEIDVQPNTSLVVATSHLESPCPSPPTWDQMFSKERVVQAKEAVKLLEKKQNVIFCGDMNWDDKLDGPFPLSDGWIDAWTELRPGEVGWTYDTKSNKMLSGNRALQKRLDRVVCKLKDFKISGIEMIGKDEIPGLSYVKEKRVKGQVKELVLPVLPSDHYGLLLTICAGDST
ncbi:hypothetical protein BUALT_Bualt03G0078100 [Buddleja alternifolia]|uniref:RanBP2-type domain-containing protein n=1 Tax=Buddleja alternifolia TaxID=168488 RepID=A0AAV6XU39_9LAMI|nr:hypothetical protein BUALT_Bualt03G0078100 [Buddleja alternifolia]